MANMTLSRRKLLAAIGIGTGFAFLKAALPALAYDYYVRIPILMGHDMDVPSEFSRFSSTIDRALQNGYTPVTMDDLLWPLVVGLPLMIEKPFVVTLDDGFKSQLNLLDFFAQRNITATFYVLPQYQDGVHTYMAENDYQLLSNAGHRVRPHTTKHLDLTMMNIDDSVSDVLLSKTIIEQVTGAECKDLAYPYGRFNDLLIQKLSSHFTAAVATVSGISRYEQRGGSIQFRSSPAEHYPENVMCLNRLATF